MADAPPTSRIARTGRVGGLVAGQGLRWAGTRAANLVRSPEAAEAATGERAAAFARELVEQLGRMRGAAMKIGQVLSTVEFTAIPEAEREQFKRTLATLRDDVPPLPWSKLEKLVRSELGGPLSEHFAEFEHEAFAAASIGQVHRAVTRDGERVAVKVQYPGMAEAVEIDLRNLGLLLPLVKRLAPGLDVRALAGELRERVAEELDYEIEAQNHRSIARAWRSHPFAHVPAVHTDLSSRRVLVTELLDGKRFEEVKGLSAAERDRFGEIVFRFFFGTLNHLGRASGDPHPGNYLLPRRTAASASSTSGSCESSTPATWPASRRSPAPSRPATPPPSTAAWPRSATCRRRATSIPRACSSSCVSGPSGTSSPASARSRRPT